MGVFCRVFAIFRFTVHMVLLVSACLLDRSALQGSLLDDEILPQQDLTLHSPVWPSTQLRILAIKPLGVLLGLHC